MWMVNKQTNFVRVKTQVVKTVEFLFFSHDTHKIFYGYQCIMEM